MGAVLTRKVVNMCIQGSSESGSPGGLSTYNFACGGYSARSGITDAMYEYNNGEYHSTADCSGTDVNVPTEAPTALDQGSGYPYCSESTCDGVDSPRADGVERVSAVVGIAFAVFASLMA